MSDFSSRLVASLQNPGLWPDRPESVGLIETHISYVLLTRDFAWKIRKPVRFDFLDFSTLEQRRRDCEEEVRLNQRTAASLYLGVVPIRGSVDRPVVGNAGAAEDSPPIEYAVQMRRFEQDDLLLHRAARQELTPELADALAEEIAAFHQSIAVESGSEPGGFGSWPAVRDSVLGNFEVLEAGPQSLAPDGPAPDVAAPAARGDSDSERAALQRLHVWTERELARLGPLIEQRRRDGFVRECHGDLHLGNLVVLNGQPVAFDAIEFNAGFRWIDVVSEVAFLIMDLEEHAQVALARRFLNRYLERTGDYGCLALLRFYLVYRALVRAKVDRLRLTDPALSRRQQRLIRHEFSSYVTLAGHDAEPARPALILMHGYSGSGKSVLSQQILEATSAIRVRSDIERKRLLAVEEVDRPDGSAQTSRYAPSATSRVYERLAGLAGQILEAGFPAIVDATFLDPAERARFRQLAERRNIPWMVVSCRASAAVLRDRVERRRQANRDVSDADELVLQQQLQRPGSADLSDIPADHRLLVETVDPAQPAAAVARIQRLLNDPASGQE